MAERKREVPMFSTNEERELRRLLTIFQDHVRAALDMFRAVIGMVSALSNPDVKALREDLERVREIRCKAAELRRRFVMELYEVSPLIAHSEDMYRLVSAIKEITDFCEGVGVRVYEIADMGWKVDRKVVEDLTRLSEATLDTLLKLREGILALSFNSSAASNIALSVYECESVVDRIYREVDLHIISSGMPLHTILLLRDITALLESIADRAEDAADLIRILSL